MSNLNAHPTDTAKAIEVAAMLGDSVVDVKHCIDPSAGKVSRKTWGIAAAGLACVLFSAAAFGHSVATASKNASKLDYWTRVTNKPAAAFRAEQLSFGYDWVAFGGLAIGVTALAGALSRSRRERRSPFYNIGTDPGVEQPVLGAPSASFPLVAPQGDDFVFNFAAGIGGEALVDGKAVPLAQLAASGHAQPSASIPGAFALPIPLNGRIRATVGQTSFLISGVPKPVQQPAPLLAAIESRTMGYFAGSLALHLGLVVLLSQIPVEDSGISIDLTSIEDVSTSLTDVANDDIPPEQEVDDDVGGGEAEASGSTKMALSGTAGGDKGRTGPSKLRIENRDLTPALAKQEAIDAARSAGLLGSVAFRNGDAFASLESISAYASGPDAFSENGAVFGADGAGLGTFGYGRSGFGTGCGGCAAGNGLIGSGGYGTLGFGKKAGDGYGGFGGGTPGGRKHSASVPPPRIGEATTAGNLDKSIIRRYIKRNLTKIGYCYEKELLAKPGLEGTVSVSFFISPNGTVTSSTGGGMDPTVANCVADVVHAIAFPRPDSGGVQVNYPFNFHPAGS